MLIERIGHFADFHIFRNKRHQEHRELIPKLVKTFKTEKVDLIYVGGDIIDSKSKLSPEQIDLASYLFYELSNIAPVIVIPGNHDANLQNKDSLDSLSPIISKVEGKNPIYYLKDTGIYNLYDIDWAVWSCLDDKNPMENREETTTYTIGCYHGQIKGCITDSYWTKFSGAVDLEIFNKCNIVLLGDIHKKGYFYKDEEIEVEEEEVEKYLKDGWERVVE